MAKGALPKHIFFINATLRNESASGHKSGHDAGLQHQRHIIRSCQFELTTGITFRTIVMFLRHHREKHRLMKSYSIPQFTAIIQPHQFQTNFHDRYYPVHTSSPISNNLQSGSHRVCIIIDDSGKMFLCQFIHLMTFFIIATLSRISRI